ncbi:putative FF domain-containing protein [Neospora caninum Liverpool]|uniref:Putative FF domain-containing protein n=1 Tax=Neospora caninum (strain Liverpool) TaxID=572307 RepID=F0VP01_NEOCL|nr:putative FF domain-containing protein [Neospora caninum Liverpool]CBZ55447.1 putative FF domain-containing protein [Neospora caninum Liverpool]|eukprot:XP_003885475.1 putative FF domain-containing protein [Neospora caninum Liverpool]
MHPLASSPLGASGVGTVPAGGRGRGLIFARADNRPHWMRAADGEAAASPAPADQTTVSPGTTSAPAILKLAAPGSSPANQASLPRTSHAAETAGAAAAAAFLHAPGAPTGPTFGNFGPSPFSNEAFPHPNGPHASPCGVPTAGTFGQGLAFGVPGAGGTSEPSPSRGPQILAPPKIPFQPFRSQEDGGAALPQQGSFQWSQPPFPFFGSAPQAALAGGVQTPDAHGAQGAATDEGSSLQEMQKRFEEQMRIQQKEILQQILQQMQAQRDASAAVDEPQNASVAGKVGKPECYEAIGSTAWYRVETTTGLKYFYHKKTKKATWTCPPEIADLVKAIDERTGGAACRQSPAAVPAAASAASAGRATARQGGDTEQESAQDREENAKRARESEESSDSDSSDDEEELEEMRQLQLQMARYEDFKQMLRERNLGPFAHYEKVLPKLLFDPRFAAIPAEQRKRLFEKCLKEVVAENRQGQKELIDAFRELMNELYESGHVHASSTVETLEKRCGHDPRWIAAGVPPADWVPIRKRLVEETIDRRRQEKNMKKNNIKRDFKKLMREKMAERPSDEWAALRKELRSHPQYLLLGSASERERIFQQVCEELTFLNEEKKRNAESAVEDAETKRARLVKTEAAAAFMNMLVERVKNPFTNSEAGSEVIPVDLLKGDSRFHTDNLSESEKQKLYVSFVEYVAVLEELQTNKRLFDGLPPAELLANFEKWKKERSNELKEAFVLWLRQNPDVCRGCDEHGEKFTKLLERLQTDIRYKRLDYIPEERMDLVRQRIREVNLEFVRKPPIAAKAPQ